MYETGKLAQVTAEMRRYELHILGVSESTWAGSGRQRQLEKQCFIRGVKTTGNHEEVAMIARKGMEKSLLEWKPVSSRLVTARQRGRQTNITLI